MSDLAIAIDYDSWATDKVAQFCAALPAGQRALTTPGTMGTVEATLIHLVAARERYASALRGLPAPDDAIRESTATDLGHVVARSKKLSEWFTEYGKGPIDVERIITRRAADGSTQQMPTGLLIAQFLHHGNEHRAQLGSIFGANGIEPPHYSAFNWGQELGKIS
jgi:uncharacterized damage-inducible protein DinB